MFSDNLLILLCCCVISLCCATTNGSASFYTDVAIQFFEFQGFHVGTPPQQWPSRFVFNNPDIVLTSVDCSRLSSKCPNYCNRPEFCQLYCDPTCCFSKASIVKQCNWDFPNVYDYNSTSLNIQPLFWYAVSDDSVGVYAKEKMDLKMMRGQLVLEDYTFALRTLGSFNWAAERENALIAHNVIGLRRRADGSSFVEDLHKSGLISTPVLSICPSSHYGFLRMHFGGLCTDCLKEEHHFVPLVEGTLEYMVDVRSAVVFDYEVHRKHRMMFSESNILYVPHDLLMYLLEENILKNHRFTEYRFLKKIPFKFQWKMTDAFSIDLNTSTVINVLPYFWSVEIETLQPNPDDVRWILSNGLFSEYGLALDYGEKRIGFARRKRDIEC